MTIVSTVIIAWVAFNVGFTAGAVWHSKMRRHRRSSQRVPPMVRQRIAVRWRAARAAADLHSG